MTQLSVRDNRIEYVGLLKKPVFNLWGEGGAILGGLYDALSPYHNGLKSFGSIGDGGSPADQAVTVDLGWQAQFRFRFDRIEAHLHTFDDSQLQTFPGVLERGAAWLLAQQPQPAFDSHLVTYRCHGPLVASNGAAFLATLPTPRLKGLGPTADAGVILHGALPSRGTLVHLTLDHSIRIRDGLFVEFQAFLPEGSIDYSVTLAELRTALDSLLAEIGLELTA